MLKDPRDSAEYRLLKFLDKNIENYNVQWCCIVAAMKPISEATTKETWDMLVAKNPPCVGRKDHKKNPNQLELGYAIKPNGQDRIKEFKPDIDAYEKQNASKHVEAEVKPKNWFSEFSNQTLVVWCASIILFFGGGGFTVGYAWCANKIDRDKFDLEQENKEWRRRYDSVLESFPVFNHAQDIPKSKTDSTDTTKYKPQ